MKKSIISILFFLQAFVAFAANDSTTVVFDSSSVETRSFDEEKINKHKSDAEFDYGNREVAGLTWWDRFKLWLIKWLSRLVNFSTTNPFGKTLLYVICGSVIIYVILKYLKLDVRKIFYSGADSGKLVHSVFEEDIYEMDFEKLIQEAIDKKEYRNAIRLIYLYALRNLSEKHLIDWEPGKTNHDYVYELENNNIKQGFIELSFYFDYAWYGDFKITEQLFNKVNNTFGDWKKGLPQ